MKIICGDNVAEMEKMEAGSIELVCCSPPYDALRSYNGFSWDFEASAKQIYRVLQDGGVCCWNVGDSVVNGSETLTSFRQALFFVDACGFRMHDTMIYNKLNFAFPDPKRYHQMFEYIFVLSKGAPLTFNPIIDRKNVTFGRGAFGLNTKRQPDGSLKPAKEQGQVSPEIGKRGNIWLGNTRGQEEPCQHKEHPAMMPKWLAKDLIISWSNEGDTVLDPFAGSFTVPIQAEQQGRTGIGIDISDEYCDIGRNAKIIHPHPELF